MIQVNTRSYYVGFGSANIIEVINNTDPPEYILIDFGSSGYANCAKQRAYERIRAINDGRYKALIFTHLDSDHINMAIDLIEKGDLKQADMVYIGGTGLSKNRVSQVPELDPVRESQSNASLLKLIRGLLEKKVCEEKDIVFLCGSEYHKPLIFWESGDGDRFNLKVLASRSCLNKINVPSGIYVNSNSAVIVAEYENQGQTACICFAGDATCATFDYILNQVKVDKNSRYDPLKKAVESVLILPHHAALNTACQGMKIVANTVLTKKLKSLSGISALLHPTCVYASAFYRKHKWHPCKNMMNVFTNVAAGAPTHKILTLECELDHNGKTKDGMPRDLICEDECRHVYTSHAYNRNFRIDNAAYNVGRRTQSDFMINKTDIIDYPNLCYELVCQMDASLPNMISYQAVVV